MVSFKARALYDFQGEPGTAEMSICAGETLTVTRTDVGEGWWEGINSKGQSGLFPEAYVEKMASISNPPSVPAPALPVQKDSGERGEDPRSQHDDDWDDDWDDETYSEIGNNHLPAQSIYTNEPNQNAFVEQFSYGSQSSQNDNISMSGSTSGGDNKGTVSKKSLNIFSSYVKSGLEGYILGTYHGLVSTTSIILHCNMCF